MDHSELITKILSDLDLDKIYSFYSAFGDTSDPEYYKKIPSFIQYPREWMNKPLTVDLIKTSLTDIINNVLNSKEFSCKSKEKVFHYVDNDENSFSIVYNEYSFGINWVPISTASVNLFL